jgi:TM2 domain-containing membrane protein YozV
MHEICPHCGKISNEESPRFCSGCGARMDGATPVGYPGYHASPERQKNPMIAGFCSTFLPGLGQVYNGQTGKGFAVFLLALIGLFLFVIPGLIVWLYGMYNAYSVAGKMNTGELAFRETRMLHMVLFIVFAVIMVVIALLIFIAMVMAILMPQLGQLDTSQLGSLSTGNFNQMFDTGDLNQISGTGDLNQMLNGIGLF